MNCCGSSERSNMIKMILFLLLTAGFFLVEVVVGHLTNSMALVADAFHMLSDLVALVIALVSMIMSPKKWEKNTFGYARAEVLGALSNAVFLLALCFSIFVEAIKKYIKPEEIENPQLVLIVGATGLAVNLIGLFLFHGGGGGHGHSHGGGGHGHSHESSHGAKTNGHSHSHKEKNGNVVSVPTERVPEQMNVRGVFLHVLGDALGSIVVIISALVVWLTDWEGKKYVDPSLSLVIVFIIAFSTIPLLKESSLVLLQVVPDKYNIEDLKSSLLLAVPQIISIHEFHIWQLVGARVILTLHASLKPDVSTDEMMAIGRNIKNFFHKQGIHSTTVQLETPHAVNLASNQSDSSQDGSSTNQRPSLPSYEDSCMLLCPKPSPNQLNNRSDQIVESCIKATCCVPKENSTAKTTRKRTTSSNSNLSIYTVSNDIESNFQTKM